MGAAGVDTIPKKARPAPQFYRPSVLLPQDAAKSPSVHKIHILGEDERSRFIAHALSGVYDSVELLSWSRSERPTSKYRNVMTKRGGLKLYRDAIPMPKAVTEDTSHIDQLIVTGQASEAVSAMEAVKDRVDENTAVCLVSDGLGVLEDVRRKVFDGTHATPDFLLGHMSQKFRFHRKLDAVRQLRQGKMMLTGGQMTRVDKHQKKETRSNLIKSLDEADQLYCSMTPYDQWLRFKLPSVIFSAVVEPVCVLMEMPYIGLLQNSGAQRMMQRLLDEIITILENMPETADSSTIRDFVRGQGIKKLIHNGIMTKGTEPAPMALHIHKGLPLDVEYLNGYFIRRGKQLGIDLKTHDMMRDMVRAKQSLRIEQLNSYISMEETSIPSELGFRYRTTPRTMPWHAPKLVR